MIEAVCETWDAAIAVDFVESPIACRTVLELANCGGEPRFAYVSLASTIEQLTGETSTIYDRSGSEIASIDLIERLLDGEIAAVLAPHGTVESIRDPLRLPAEFVSERQKIRRDIVLVRFLLRQIGLEEVSAHRGAPSILFDKLAALWSQPLSLCVDPAMMLTLGADRQRYVDAEYTERATDRLPRALGRLHDLGVRSYPRLVIA